MISLKEALKLSGDEISALRAELKDKILEINGEKKIDVRKNAGYITYVKEIPVGVAWKMWLGNNYYNWIPKETLVEFKDCYQNIEIGNNIQKIIMTKTLEEFTNDKTDDIKWNFRKKLNLNSITEKIEEFEKKKEISSDEEIFEAFFVDKKYYEIRYFDKKGRSIEKKYAKFYKVEEYDLVENEKVGRFLGETIGKIENLDIEKLKKGYYRRTEYNDVLECLKIIKNGERINKFDTEIMLQNIADYEKKEILEKIERLNELLKYQEIIDLIRELGYSLSAQGKYEEAIEKFEYVLSLEVEDEGNLEFVYSQLGWCYRHLWKFEKALEYLNKAKEEGRNDAWINVEMALCYENLEEHEKALEYALIAYELDKNDVHVLSELGVIYGCMEKYEEALSFLIKAEKLDKNDEWINTEIAINLGRSGKVNEGIKRLKKSLTMVGKDDIDRKIIINSELAWFYGKLEESKTDEALKHLNIAKELGRDDEWLHSEIGYQLGQNPETSKEALEHFEKAMKLGRKDAWIFEMVACALFNLDRYEEALDYFRKAYAEKNDNWYLYSMGNCLRALERYEEAIKVLLESRQISIDKNDVVDGEDFELAYCYIGIGDKENAQKYLDLARDSVIKQGALNEYVKEDIEEIEEGIRSLEN